MMEKELPRASLKEEARIKSLSVYREMALEGVNGCLWWLVKTMMVLEILELSLREKSKETNLYSLWLGSCFSKSNWVVAALAE